MAPTITFIWRDIRARRTILEVLLGLFSICACTIALTVVVLFTDGFYRFLDFSFERAKPVIGSVHVTERSRGLVSARNREKLEKLVKNSNPKVESVSWVAVPSKFDIRGSDLRGFDLSPLIWSLPPGGDEALSAANGVHYVVGSALEDLPETLDFGVLVNLKFLEDFLFGNEQQTRAILSGEAEELIPKVVRIHFAPIQGSTEAFEPGIVELPVQGVFDPA